jgi:hypothetical protein
MAYDFTVALQFSQREQSFFSLRTKLHTITIYKYYTWEIRELKTRWIEIPLPDICSLPSVCMYQSGMKILFGIKN